MDTARFLNWTILDAVGRGKVGDLYGVELELEGRGVRMEGVAAKGWRRTDDGSLRGESVEFVFSDPCAIDTARERVNNLFAKMKANGVDLKNSYRTSTHVHINFGDKKVKELLNFFILFTMLEEILEIYSGEDRVGNLFCLSSRRSEAVIDALSKAVKHTDFGQFANDRYKYAACNLSTLYKFGTAEIRTMRGADSAEQVVNWLNILDALFKRAIKAKSPIEFIENISRLGPDGFLDDVFPLALKRELIKGLPVGFDFRASLLNGARLCQLFVYELADDYDAVIPAGNAVGVRMGRRNPGPLRADPGRIVVHNPRTGSRWVCTPDRGMVFFDGDAVSDDHRIVYDEAVGRFKYGRFYLWYYEHPVFGDESQLRRAEGKYCRVDGPEEPELDDINEDDDF